MAAKGLQRNIQSNAEYGGQRRFATTHAALNMRAIIISIIDRLKKDDIIMQPYYGCCNEYKTNY